MSRLFLLRQRRLLKFTAMFMSFIFLSGNVVLAEQVNMTSPHMLENINIPANAKRINDLFIPEGFGSIEKRWEPESEENNRFIILIKDAHCHYEAQHNIAKILEVLVRDYGIDLVGIEGAEGDLDLSRYGQYSDEKIKEKAVDMYVKKGYATGTEYLNITKYNKLPFGIYGIEDGNLYVENFIKFRETWANNNEIEYFIKKIGSIIEQLKAKIYSKELFEVDKKEFQYNENKISLTDWVKYLSSQELESSNQKNFGLVLRAIRLEGRIDFKKVEKERAEIIKILEKNLPKEAIEELIRKSLEFRLGKISQAEYYKYIEQYILEQPSSQQMSVINLKRYIHLIKIQSRIDSDCLFSEIELVTKAIKEALFQNELQKKLDNLSRRIQILNKLFRLQLQRKDLEYLRINRDEFSTDSLLSLINIQAPLNNITIPPLFTDDNFLTKFNNYIIPADRFYEVAIERDRVLVEKIINKMEEENKEKSIMVVGGFHSEGITKILRDKNVNYVVISPKITKEQLDNPYLSIMLDKKIDYNTQTLLQNNLANPELLSPMSGPIRSGSKDMATTVQSGLEKLIAQFKSGQIDQRQLREGVQALNITEQDRAVVEKMLEGISNPTIKDILREVLGVEIITNESAAGNYSLLEQYFTTPLLKRDSLPGDELKLIFRLFGQIELKFVSSDSFPQKDVVIQNIYDESGRLQMILCSDRFTGENLIDILGVLCNLNPGRQQNWRPLAIRVYSYFRYWERALKEYSTRSDVSETTRDELTNLWKYFSKLAEKIKNTLGLSEQVDDEVINTENTIRGFINRALNRTKKIGTDKQQKWVKRLELFFSRHLTTYLTDQIDRVLIENVFGQFKQIIENWDVLSSRNEILVGMMGEDGSEKFNSWLELASSRFQKLQDENSGNPEKLRQLHIQFAQEIGKVIRTQFPDYSSGKYHLGKVAEANKANCVGYATMFYLIAKEIGLNVAYTSVEYTGDKEIHHAANLLHLPSVNGEDSFVVVDVTWNNYISEPINEASIDVQYKDDILRRIAIPQTMSKHNVVVEYRDPLYGIQHAIYSWSSSSNDFLTNPNLQKRVAEKMLRINPKDANALRLLGRYYASPEGEDAHNINSAISYLQRSLKLKVDWVALHELKRLSLKSGKIGDFYRFCEQLLSIHNSPNTYIVVAHTIKLDNARGNEAEIMQKTLEVLENGLKMFPENSNIMKELASAYMDLYTHLSEASEKRHAYDMAIDYMERTLKKAPADGELLNKYWQLIRKEESGSERFVVFCSEIMQANPHLAQPVCALMHHYEMQKNEEGYNTAIRLAKEYLEKPESTDRRRALWSLRAIYTNMIYETDRQGNIYYGKIDDLLQYLHELLGKFPDSFATVQCIAETYMRTKRFGEAIPYLQRFSQRFPHNKECLEALITCQAAVKDWQGVVTTAEATFDADSNNMTALKLAGIAYEESGRYGEAIIKFERFLALYGGYSDASDIKTRLAFCQERARGAMLQPGGPLKDIGIPGTGEVARTDSMTLMRWEDLAVGEKIETKVIKGISIAAKFIYSEPLGWGAMPKGMSSYHFYDGEGNLVIVGAYYLSEEEMNEAFYHEGRKAHWITVLSDEARQSNRELTEGLLNTIRRNAHILASAEESIAFGDPVLTPFHKRQVASMSQGLLEQLLQENRQTHHDLIKARLSAADYGKYLSYEQRFVSKLEQKLSMPDRRTQVQELRRLGETLQQQFGITLDDIYLNEDKVSQNQGLLLESDYPEVKVLLERTIANLRQSHPAWLQVVRGKTLRIAKLLGEGRNIGGRADLDNGTFTLVLDSYAYQETLDGRVSMDKGIAAADGTKYSNEQWILFHEIAHLMDPYRGQAVSAFFDQAGIDRFLQSDEYVALLNENQQLEAELKQRGLFTSPAPYLVRTPNFIDKLNRIRDEIDKNKYYRAILAKGSRTITTTDMQGYTITPYAGASRFELWAESLTAYFLCPDLLRQKDPAMFFLISMVISSQLTSNGLPYANSLIRGITGALKIPGMADAELDETIFDEIAQNTDPAIIDHIKLYQLFTGVDITDRNGIMKNVSVYFTDKLPPTMHAYGKVVNGKLIVMINKEYISQEGLDYLKLAEVIDHEWTEHMTESGTHRKAAARQKKYFWNNGTELTPYHKWVLDKMDVAQFQAIIDEYEGLGKTGREKRGWGEYEKLFYEAVKQKSGSISSIEDKLTISRKTDRIFSDEAIERTEAFIGKDRIEIVLDSRGVVLDIIETAKQFGLNIYFAGGTARRMVLGKNPLRKTSDIDIMVDVPRGNVSDRELIDKVEKFMIVITKKYPELEIDIMNFQNGTKIENPYDNMEDKRSATIDRLLVGRAGDRWFVFDTEGGVCLKDAKTEIILKLVPKTTNDGKIRKLSYDGVVRFVRLIAEFPNIPVYPDSLEEIRRFVADNTLTEWGRTIDKEIDGFNKGDGDYLMRLIVPPYKALLNTFINSENPDEVINLLRRIGDESRNLYFIFRSVVDLEEVIRIINEKRKIGVVVKKSDFDSVFEFSPKAMGLAGPFDEEGLIRFLKQNLGNLDVEDEKNIDIFVREDLPEVLEYVNGKYIFDRIWFFYFLICRLKSILFANRLYRQDWYLSLKGFISADFYEYIREFGDTIADHLCRGQYRNILQYYVKEYMSIKASDTERYPQEIDIVYNGKAIRLNQKDNIENGIQTVLYENGNEPDYIYKLLRDDEDIRDLVRRDPRFDDAHKDVVADGIIAQNKNYNRLKAIVEEQKANGTNPTILDTEIIKYEGRIILRQRKSTLLRDKLLEFEREGKNEEYNGLLMKVIENIKENWKWGIGILPQNCLVNYCVFEEHGELIVLPFDWGDIVLERQKVLDFGLLHDNIEFNLPDGMEGRDLSGWFRKELGAHVVPKVIENWDSFSKEKTAEVLGIEIGKVKELLDNLSRSGISERLSRQLLYLMNADGRIDSSEVQAMIDCIDKTLSAIDIIGDYLSDLEKKEAVKRLGTYLAILKLQKEAQIQDVWLQLPGFMNQLKDKILLKVTMEEEDVKALLIELIHMDVEFVYDETGNLVDTPTRLEIYLNNLISICGEEIRPLCNELIKYKQIQVKVIKALRVDSRDIKEATPSINIAEVINSYLRDKKNKNLMANIIVRYLMEPQSFSTEDAERIKKIINRSMEMRGITDKVQSGIRNPLYGELGNEIDTILSNNDRCILYKTSNGDIYLVAVSRENSTLKDGVIQLLDVETIDNRKMLEGVSKEQALRLLSNLGVSYKLFGRINRFSETREGKTTQVVQPNKASMPELLLVAQSKVAEKGQEMDKALSSQGLDLASMVEKLDNQTGVLIDTSLYITLDKEQDVDGGYIVHNTGEGGIEQIRRLKEKGLEQRFLCIDESQAEAFRLYLAQHGIEYTKDEFFGLVDYTGKSKYIEVKGKFKAKRVVTIGNPNNPENRRFYAGIKDRERIIMHEDLSLATRVASLFGSIERLDNDSIKQSGLKIVLEEYYKNSEFIGQIDTFIEEMLKNSIWCFILPPMVPFVKEYYNTLKGARELIQQAA